MTLKQLIKIEDNAKEIWVISPFLHYDVDNKSFSEIVSVNLGQKTKYKYIVPATKDIHKNLDAYKNKYHLTKEEISENFLLLPDSEFSSFMLEIAIYDANSQCIACAAPGIEGGNEVIRFDDETAKKMAKQFKSVWKKYKMKSL